RRENEIAATRQRKLLPHDRVKGDVGADTQNLHVLDETSVRNFQRIPLPLILRQSQQIDPGVLLSLLRRTRSEIFGLYECNDRIGMFAGIKWRPRGRRLGE